MQGMEGGEVTSDDRFVAPSDEVIGATIMGRNMFGPSRGPWENDDWKGWWGDDPPFHHPVFVLTHHAREPIPMQGGTTFHFVTGGIEEALERAAEAAGDLDVSIGGGAQAIQQYLKAGLVDEMEVHVMPMLLSRGERLFENVVGSPSGYECVELVSSPRVAHYRLARKA
jgi:dihydrofolate reductase